METFGCFVIITSILLALVLYFLCKRDPRVKRELDKFGGPPCNPIFGCSLYLRGPHNKVLPQLGAWTKAHGPSYVAWIGNIIPYFVTVDADAVEKLISGTSNLDKGKYEYSLFTKWIGTGLLTAPGVKWTPRRKLLQPSFHFKILEDFLPVFNEQATVFLNCLKTDNHEIGGVFNMYPYITRCALDMICETSMGIKMHVQTSPLNQSYIEAVDGMCRVIVDKTMKPWLRISFFANLTGLAKQEKEYIHTLQSFTRAVIDSRRQKRRLQRKAYESKRLKMTESDKEFDDDGPYGKNRKAFLDLLLDAADETKELTYSDICEEVDTFMFEGHDTTAVCFAWTVLLLAMHPDCQATLQQEMDQMFADDPNRDVTVADLSEMKYLECCIKESLRLYPSVPFIMRQIHEDIPVEEGKIIPKGATGFINIFHLHRNPKYFPEPECYIPERFFPTSPKFHPYAFIPFSAGARNCIGRKFAMLELKIVLTKLFRTYNISTKETLDTLRPLPNVVERNENGVQVKIRPRKNE